MGCAKVVVHVEVEGRAWWRLGKEKSVGLADVESPTTVRKPPYVSSEEDEEGFGALSGFKTPTSMRWTACGWVWISFQTLGGQNAVIVKDEEAVDASMSM